MPKGRPALAGEPKEGRLIIRHTEAERALLDAAAAKTGKPTSTWARDELLRLASQEGPAGQPAAAKKTSAKKATGTPAKRR